MEREAKAKVVASVWGAEFIQFLATLAILHTVSTTQPNFLIYSEAAVANLYIRKCFQIYNILTYILGNVSKFLGFLLIY